MAYGLKYYKEFAWTNYANDTTGNTRIEILENNYSGASVEIDELGETPVQLRMDNTGDMINQTIKKTSLVLSIVDTDQFDYSQFYTSDGKKYKVNLISSVANWTGYLVPQSFGQELGTNGLISITASDGLHLLQGIDYVADKNKTLKLADFIADIETKIGLGTFDRSVSLATDKGDLWQQFIYEGMFLDKNYEDCLDMVLTAYGLQVRYWKLFPVTSILSHSFSGSVKCLDNVPMVDYLPIAKKLKINHEITTLPNILEDAMMKDVTDYIQRSDGNYFTFKNWQVASNYGLGLSQNEISVGSGFIKALNKINVRLLTEGLDNPGYNIYADSGSKYRIRKFKSSNLTLKFNANFGRIAVKFPGYTLRGVSWSEIRWGLYDNVSGRSYNQSLNNWSIVGSPTAANSNAVRVTNPTDSDIDVFVEIISPTGSYCDLELYLFTGKCKLSTNDYLNFSSTMSISEITLDGEEVISDKELYKNVNGVVNIGDNIDIIDYNYEFGDSPTPPTNTSLYYGSSLYNNIYDQITSFTLAGNSVNQMQYLANTILYSNGAGRKSVFSGTFAPMSNGNLMFYRANVNNVNCLINSFTLDVRRVKFVDAEFVEIAPFSFTNYTITSESSIGSSDWGGSGGSSGTIGGGGGTVDTSNFVVKTGAVTQNIEGSVTVEGAVVAGATNSVLPDDLPVATGSLYGVVKIDDVTIKIDANGKIYAIATGGVSSWNDLTDKPANLVALASLTGSGIVKRNSDGSFSIDTSVYLTAITKTMVEAVLTGDITTHTHSQYLLASAYTASDVLTKIKTVDGTGSGLDADLLDGQHASSFLRNLASVFDQNANLLDLMTTAYLQSGGTNMPNGHGNGWVVTFGSSQIFIGNTLNEIWYRKSRTDTWYKIWTSLNSNLKTVDWSAKDLKCVNTFADGAVVAGALNGTLPDDLPVATSSLFGVIKTGLSLNNNAGVVNINGRHYTTTSTYTDASVREITAELALGTGSMANGTLDQIKLDFAPLTTTRGLTANVIATDTGAGMGLKLSFRKDTGTGRWYIMIYNDSGASVTRDGILLSIRGQQTI